MAEDAKTLTDKILVVQNSVLLENSPFYGFSPANRRDYKNVILNNHEFKSHGEMSSPDSMQDFTQIVACYFIINPELGLISTYSVKPSVKNSVNDDAHPNTLRNELSNGDWSCGYKSHIRAIDSSVGDGLDDTIVINGITDLRRDIQIEGKFLDAKILGYISGVAYKNVAVPNTLDASKDVNGSSLNETERIRQTHFMIVYALSTDARHVVSVYPEIYSLMPKISTLEKKIDFLKKRAAPLSVELSTRQSIGPLSRYVNSFNTIDSFR